MLDKSEARKVGEQLEVNCYDKVEVRKIGEQSRMNCYDKSEARKIGEQLEVNCYDKLEAKKIGEQLRVGCDRKSCVEENPATLKVPIEYSTLYGVNNKPFLWITFFRKMCIA